MSRLALFGGPPVRATPIPCYTTIGEAEKRAAQRVLESGVLSNFYGSHCPEFYGGPEVQAFEREWAAYMQVPYAVTMNSATSGLFAAVGALEIGPGDEVIVSPYTMSATAAGILVYHAIPVFADIDPEIFCLNPESVERAITPRTKAIIVTHLFGHPADLEGLLRVARRHGLRVIEDAAQSPGALHHGRSTGTIGDIGVFSLNCHKIIQTGEGGVCVTNDAELAKRLQLIRNHAEAVVSQGMPVTSLVNMVGWNYRMTEIEAAIGREQLKRLRELTDRRQHLAAHLSKRLSALPGVQPPTVRDGCTHGYYVYALLLDPEAVGISRDLFARALRAEGIPVMAGYMRPLYLQEVYQRKILFGKSGCPFTCSHYDGTVDYREGLCPVTEQVEQRLLGFECVRDPLTVRDMETIADAFEKVLDEVETLRTKAVAGRVA